MLKFFRSKHSQYFVFVVLALLFLSFLFYSNAGSSLIASSRDHQRFGKIDGKEVTPQEFHEAESSARIEAFFASGQFMDPNASMVWADLIFENEAEKLQITIPDDAVVKFVQDSPYFEDEKGVYQPARYSEMLQTLQSRGISEDDFTQGLSRKFSNEAVNKALFGNIHASKGDEERNFKQIFGPVNVSIWRFNQKAFESEIVVTPEEAKQEYTAHPDDPAYHEDEKREVQYVIFHAPPGLNLATATPEQKTPTVEAAVGFYVKLQPVPGTNTAPATMEDLVKTAPELALKVQSSGLFTIHTPAQGLPPSPHFNSAAFALTMDHPVSKPIEVPSGLAVMKLVKIVPGNMKDFASVQQLIIDKIKAQRARLEIAQMEADFTSGKLVGPALQAIASSGKIVESKLSFDPINAPPEVPRSIIHQIENLQDGEMSPPFDEQEDPDSREPVKAPTTPLTVMRVDSRVAVPKATHDLYWERFCQRQDSEYQQQAEFDWVAWRSNQPGTEPLPGTQFGKAAQPGNLPSE